MATGGSIQQVTIAGRIFTVAADNDAQRNLGGFSNEQQSNGDGSTRQVKTRMPWKLGGLQLTCDDTLDDHEFLQDVADNPENVPISALFANGEVFEGLGTITGELQVNTMPTTADVELSGPYRFTRQVV